MDDVELEQASQNFRVFGKYQGRQIMLKWENRSNKKLENLVSFCVGSDEVSRSLTSGQRPKPRGKPTKVKKTRHKTL
jgi:hypothetical protein